MRVLWAITVLVGCALAGYASSDAAAQGEATQAALTSGEKVRLYFDPVLSATDCIVIEVRGDFVGCKFESQDVRIGQPRYDRWYNLRLISRIERPARQE